MASGMSVTADAESQGRRTAGSGTVLWVAAGLAVYGGASFVFLAIAGRSLGDTAGYTALALVWTLLNALGIGPRDLISILQAIKAAGALQADIEVM